jgi:multidrug resistance efflux pump
MNMDEPMNFQDRTLVRKLATVLVIKLVVLVALWWWFVREQRVPVDTNATASQMLGASPAPIPTLSGATP